jgi:predicted MFS family arabinose efflux permease
MPRQVRLLIAARAVNQLGAFSLAFLTVLLCRAFGASLGTAGAVSAAFGLATIPSRLLGGRLADRLGRRRTMLTGLAGCAAAQLGIAIAPDLAVAAGCAVLLGLAFELYEPPSQAIIADAAAPGDRAPAYALLTTALAVGNTGAGLVAAAVGRSNLRWLFAVDAATCLACALIVRLALPADQRPGSPAARRPRAAAGGGFPARRSSPWRDRALLTMTAAGTVFALIYMLLLVSLPLSLAAHGINAASAGLVMAVSALTLVLARPLLRTRRLARISSPAAFAAGYSLMGLGLAGYAAAASLPALLAPTVAWSLGYLLLSGRAFAVVAGLAPAGAAARYLAVYGLSWGVATVAAPVLGTQLIGSLGPASLWVATAALCLAMAAVQPCLLHWLPARRNQIDDRDRAPACPSLVRPSPAGPQS